MTEPYRMPQPEQWLEDHHVVGLVVGLALVAFVLALVLWVYSVLPAVPW